jgi:hypothetical protein
VDTHDDYQRALAIYRRLFTLPPDERYLGEKIIAAYKSIFAAAAAPGGNE